MLTVLQIGPLALPVPQFSMLLALWLGLTLAEKQASRHIISAELLYNLVFTGLVAGLLGARLGYVFQYPSAFIQSPLSLLSLNIGLLDLLSGLGIGLLGMLIYGQRQKLPFWKTLDALTPLLAVLAVGLAISHLASGEAYGAATSLPWAVNMWGAWRHPSQFYELAGAILILVLATRRMNIGAKPGAMFLGFVAMSAMSRLFLEAFRGDSLTLPGGYRQAQIVAWLVLAVTLILLDIIKRKPQKETLNG